MAKRPDGALESAIMSVLWASSRPLQPGEINDLLTIDLAYTSVATVLSRLRAKGLVRRSPAGRGFAYQAAASEAELAARRIGDVLSAANDRSAVLAGFIGSLSHRDTKALRTLLDLDGP